LKWVENINEVLKYIYKNYNLKKLYNWLQCLNFLIQILREPDKGSFNSNNNTISKNWSKLARLKQISFSGASESDINY
jgi:hypothetical protein